MNIHTHHCLVYYTSPHMCLLSNCSCFANVVLQCLACTRPLVAYLLEKDHNRECMFSNTSVPVLCISLSSYYASRSHFAGLRRRDDWCFLCEVQIHIKRASESLQSFSPINILSRLPNIGGNLGYGRQEDAHEFMRSFAFFIIWISSTYFIVINLLYFLFLLV